MDVTYLTHEEAVEEIRRAGDRVELLVQSPYVFIASLFIYVLIYLDTYSYSFFVFFQYLLFILYLIVNRLFTLILLVYAFIYYVLASGQ